MLNRIVTFALTQRLMILGGALVILIWGLFALRELPIQAFPDVQDVQVQVITQLPGQAPPEVERMVTLPIEREMNGIPGLTQARSISMMGLSVITMTFADGVEDHFARQQVIEKLSNASLPPGIQPDLAPLTTGVGEIYRYVVKAPPTMSIEDVRVLEDWVIRPAIRSVAGIADVVSFGGTIKEYQVAVNPEKLRRFNVTLTQVSQALQNNSTNAGGGIMRRGDEALVIRGLGYFQTIDDIGRVAITTNNGTPVLVSDVADINIGGRPRSGYVALDGNNDVVEGIVNMLKGGNPSTIIAALKAKIDEINKSKLPPGVQVEVTYDRSGLVDHTVRTVSENLVLGALLVLVVLIIFLRSLIAALIVACVIPLSLLVAFIGMHVWGVSANLISLGAIDFGILVDSAVVLVEALMVRLALAAVDRHPGQAKEEWRWHVLLTTSVSVGRPVLFAKAIIISAFLPIFTFQRVEGKIFSPMAFTLSFAILGAILVTLTLIPALLSYTLKNDRMKERHSPWMHRLQQYYRRVIRKVITHRKAVFALSSLLVVISLVLAPRLGTEFLPKLDEGNIWLTITLPVSTALEKTKEVEQEVRQILRTYPEITRIITQVGRPDDGTDPKGANNLEVLALLKERKEWRFTGKDEMIQDMAKRLETIPGVNTNFSQAIQDNVEEALSGVKGEIAIKIFGPNLEILEAKAEEVAHSISGVHGAADVEAFRISGLAQANITLQRDRLARYGINVSEVNNVVQAALGGAVVNNFFEGDRSFDVTLRYAASYRDSVSNLGELTVPTANGDALIPLKQLADIEIEEGPASIRREDSSRVAAIKANIMGRDQGSFVDEAMDKVANEVKLPPGYYMTWGGQFENQKRAVKRLEIIVPVSLLLIFLLLFSAFQSMRDAGLVLLMIPFSLIGGLGGLAVTDLHLSVSAAVGFIALAGISVQNGVIMVEQIKELLRSGKNLADAVEQGAVLRLRPVLMTALMAGLGLLPAALSHGIGSETQRPFAVVIVGGLVSATLLTLVLVPVLFAWMHERHAQELAS